MQSVDELFAIVVREQDDDSRWNAIRALHALGSREVFDRALKHCRGASAAERTAGVDVIGQLTMFFGEAQGTLCSMLEDGNPVVVESVVHAMGQQQNLEMIEEFSRVAGHRSANVRWAVATALEDHVGDERAERVMLSLMRDDDTSVRDRATFAVGSLSDHDTPRIRAALVERLQDQERCVANEAALGLARRRDARAIPYIALAMTATDGDIEEAADEITSAEMLGELIKARELLPDPHGLETLIERCRARGE